MDLFISDRVGRFEVPIFYCFEYVRGDPKSVITERLKAYKNNGHKYTKEAYLALTIFASAISSRILDCGVDLDNTEICWVPTKMHQPVETYHLTRMLPMLEAVLCGHPIVRHEKNPLRFVRVIPPVKNVKLKQRGSVVHNSLIAADRVFGKRFLVLDDIRASGATLRECARALYAAGAAEVASVVVAQRTDLLEEASYYEDG